MLTQKSNGELKMTQSGLEIQVRNLLDITFKYNWIIENYLRRMDKHHELDSEPFEVNVNGIKTKWSLALRFWTGSNGQKLSNPVVVCLNLLEVSVDAPEDVRIRYQFGVYNDIAKQYEAFSASSVNLLLETNDKMTSLGYRDVCVLDRHLALQGDVQLFCKIMIVRKAVELHTLSFDLMQILLQEDYTDATLSVDGQNFRVHKNILCARSPVFAAMFKTAMSESISSKVQIEDISPEIMQSLLQYIYTDQVDGLDSQSQSLLAVAEKYQLAGLKGLCERSLMDSITPSNIASILLTADSFNCDSLKKAALGFCEDNAHCIVKNVGWKVMEDVNPELFEEACEMVKKDNSNESIDCIRQNSPKNVRVP